MRFIRTWATVLSLTPSTTCWPAESTWSFTPFYEVCRKKKCVRSVLHWSWILEQVLLELVVCSASHCVSDLSLDRGAVCRWPNGGSVNWVWWSTQRNLQEATVEETCANSPQPWLWSEVHPWCSWWVETRHEFYLMVLKMNRSEHLELLRVQGEHSALAQVQGSKVITQLPGIRQFPLPCVLPSHLP